MIIITIIHIITQHVQNTDKLNEVRATIDQIEALKTTEKTRIIENKLSTAEQNREKELQKKLENIRKHVGFLQLLYFHMLFTTFIWDLFEKLFHMQLYFF